MPTWAGAIVVAPVSILRRGATSGVGERKHGDARLGHQRVAVHWLSVHTGGVDGGSVLTSHAFLHCFSCLVHWQKAGQKMTRTWLRWRKRCKIKYQHTVVCYGPMLQTLQNVKLLLSTLRAARTSFFLITVAMKTGTQDLLRQPRGKIYFTCSLLENWNELTSKGLLCLSYADFNKPFQSPILCKNHVTSVF